MNKTAISWTDATWNPVSGCSRVSEGCRFCYAERISLKFRHTSKPWTATHAVENVQCHTDRLRHPYALKVPSRVFVNSMSDLWHPLVPDAFIADVFSVMADLPQHTFQILTKRPARAAAWDGIWPRNVWQGTSIEDARVVSRIDALRQCGAVTRFLSCEPLIGPLDNLDLSGIHWVIVGGESGFHMTGPDHSRWMRQEWARSIRDTCVRSSVAFFYKQDAGYKTELRPWLVEQDGSRHAWHQFPDHLTDPIPVLGPSR